MSKEEFDAGMLRSNFWLGVETGCIWTLLVVLIVAILTTP
jgi:hypothetical protein